MSQPFNVFAANGRSKPEFGTSFAAPLSLRSSAGSWIQLGNRVTPLAVRALMVHRADDGQRSRSEVGWGRFEVDPELMVTCPDDEPLIIYQGSLPAGAHLRAPVPVPDLQCFGHTINASIKIRTASGPGKPEIQLFLFGIGHVWRRRIRDKRRIEVGTGCQEVQDLSAPHTFQPRI